jgi:UDP-N-acetylglucosamine 2-epimerase
MKIDCVVGARPNFIKISPLIAEMARRSLRCRLIHTGQHYDYDMNDKFFEELNIPSPDVNLGIGSNAHGRQTGQAMIALEEEFLKDRPDLVLVVGDVNSTLAGALAAVKLNIPVAHVEAGYRSFDRRMPEEINRVLVDHSAELLFAPTRDAVDNLIKEGIDHSKVHFVGNIMAETLLRNREKIRTRNKCDQFQVRPRGYAIATIHRPENVDDMNQLARIMGAFSEAPLPVILPLHPRTKKRMKEFGIQLDPRRNLTATESLSYLDMLNMISNAALVVTDSGGVQEEACLLQVPCLTIRSSTERIATIRAGANRLIATDGNSILASISELAQKVAENRIVPWQVPPKWDDQVSKRVMDSIETIMTGLL